MFNISTNKELMEEGTIASRLKDNTLSYDELQIEIVETLASIIGEDSVDEVYKKARVLTTSYLNFLTQFYSKESILDFMVTRDHWKDDLEPDSLEEAGAAIVESSYKLMSTFCSLIVEESEKGFLFKDILLIISAINYFEENK